MESISSRSVVILPARCGVSRVLVLQAGFTLIELLVVTAIITVVTSIALVGQSSFNRSVLLTDAAYILATSVRQAQSLGLSSREFGGTGNAGYGIDVSAGADFYTVFADLYPSVVAKYGAGATPEKKPGNGLYDPSHSELFETYRFGRGVTIGSVCGVPQAGGEAICSGAGQMALRSADVVFTRPNTETVITGTRQSGSTVPLANASMTVVAPSGESRCVNVSQVGQISVSAVCP